MVNADNAQQTITTLSQGIQQQCRRKRFHGDRFLIYFRSQGMLLCCPSTNPMHVKFEAPINMSSCSRQLDLIKDIKQRLLSRPTFKKRNFRKNYCAAPW